MWNLPACIPKALDPSCNSTSHTCSLHLQGLCISCTGSILLKCQGKQWTQALVSPRGRVEQISVTMIECLLHTGIAGVGDVADEFESNDSWEWDVETTCIVRRLISLDDLTRSPIKQQCIRYLKPMLVLCHLFPYSSVTVPRCSCPAVVFLFRIPDPRESFLTT